MKIKIGPYPNRWMSNIHTRYMDKKYGGWGKWEDNSTRFESFFEKFEDLMQTIYNCTINLFLDRRVQKVKVHIDRWDTWNMDDTLAPIILPMLKQLKETKHGAPIVDNVDVPEEFRMPEDWYEKHSTLGEVDPMHFKRWDYVLDEMIWAFEQKCRDDWMEDYHYNKWDTDGANAHQARMSNGFRLFGTYFENLWD